MGEGPSAFDRSAGPALLALRAAAGRLDDVAARPDGPDGDAADAAVDVERFEAMHEALTAVLDDLDQA